MGFEFTGLKVKIVGLIGVYSDPKNRIVKYPDNDNVVHKVDVILEAEIVSVPRFRSVAFGSQIERIYIFNASCEAKSSIWKSALPSRPSLIV